MSKHAASTSVMSIVIFVIGVVLTVRTIADGGGGVATGVILGVLFMAAGAGRFYVGWTRR